MGMQQIDDAIEDDIFNSMQSWYVRHIPKWM
jgi:hypothetical protein